MHCLLYGISTEYYNPLEAMHLKLFKLFKIEHLSNANALADQNSKFQDLRDIRQFELEKLGIYSF